MTLIISDNSKGNIGMILKESFCAMGIQVAHFAADTLNIKPCVSCNSCGGKTYGRCVIPDDMQQLYPRIVRCQELVLVSPIVFGGVSYHIKKVMDRMAAVGDPRYWIKDGEIVKGMSNKELRYYMVGFGDNISEAEQTAFLCLHKENQIIMNVSGKAFICDSLADKQAINIIAREIVDE